MAIDWSTIDYFRVHIKCNDRLIVITVQTDPKIANAMAKEKSINCNAQYIAWLYNMVRYIRVRKILRIMRKTET